VNRGLALSTAIVMVSATSAIANDMMLTKATPIPANFVAAYDWSEEKILETYYAYRPDKWSTFTFDYQFVADPAYNADRGPVHIFAGRFSLAVLRSIVQTDSAEIRSPYLVISLLVRSSSRRLHQLDSIAEGIISVNPVVPL
jgi:Carbohydrate-selective porin, OprB family